MATRAAATKPARSPRTRGRPAATSGAEVRATLLQAARRLFLKHGYAKVTARQIAAAAQTTPAMIHYYFEDKGGLFRAMLNDAIQPLFRLVDGTAVLDLQQLIRLQMQINAANPWIATLIVNEVFAGEGRLRALFIREVAARVLPRLIGLLTQARAAGRMQADLDPRLTALSLLSLNMFPFIARSVVAAVLDLKLEGADLEALIEHNTGFFLRGAGWTGAGEVA